MSKNDCVKRKRGWSDVHIYYGFEIFRDQDAHKLNGQCVICTLFKFLRIASRLIKINLSKTLKSRPWKILKMKMGHGYKEVGTPVINYLILRWLVWLQMTRNA